MFFIPKLKPHPTFSAEENDQVFIFNPESIEVWHKSQVWCYIFEISWYLTQMQMEMDLDLGIECVLKFCKWMMPECLSCVLSLDNAPNNFWLK